MSQQASNNGYVKWPTFVTVIGVIFATSIPVVGMILGFINANADSTSGDLKQVIQKQAADEADMAVIKSQQVELNRQMDSLNSKFSNYLDSQNELFRLLKDIKTNLIK